MTSTTLREMLVKQEPRCISTCYVCAGSRAEYIICSKPHADAPFFPFLEQHQPPEGAESMRSDGRVLVCNVCYNLLNQQWNSFEKTKTPYTKRLYWLKRLDNGPFAGMDLNLQQDYESLFEASSSGVDTEHRKVKQPRNQFTPNCNVIKSKSAEYSDSNFSSNFGFQMQAPDKCAPAASNILDLSLSTRTSSRSSSSASPGMSYEACYMCGLETKNLSSVYVNTVPHLPFFPSLRNHPKPMKSKPIDIDGSVHVCKQCHTSLVSQWDYYQKQGIPHQERNYKSIISIPVNDTPVRDKTFVCYTCGMVAQLSVQRIICAYQERGDPYFSFLLHIPPHPGANKLSSGKASVCSVCYKSLYRQYQVFEVSNTPEERRKYKILNENVADNGSVLRQHLESISQETVAESKFACYLCESFCDSFISISTVPTDDMYFPFIRNFPKPASAISVDIHGQVKVCSKCHSSLRYQWQTFEHASIPINQRQYKIPVSKSQESEFLSANSLYAPSLSAQSNVEEHGHVLKRGPDKCSLCERPFSDEVYFLETVPREKCMHFPSLRSLVKSNNFIDQYGRIPACYHCFMFLKNQWEIFESAHVPHSQRQYEIATTKVDREHMGHYPVDSRLSEASAALHIQVSSPDLKIDLSKHSSSEPLLTTVNTLPVSSITLTNAPIDKASHSSDLKVASKPNQEESTARICGPLDIPFVRPLLLVPIHCFVCGELNSTGLTFPIKSQPTGNVKGEECVPFFPFLSKHTPPEGTEKLANDGTALSCMFCYHSLVSQWYAYEASPFPEDKNPWTRRYNTHNYVCYICGITTYRQRIHSISVKNFPFLLEHKRPNGALTLLSGDSVVTCQTCYESITSQWKDFERMKVPIEMRMYNWIVVKPPPDDENSRGCQILQENSGSKLPVKETDQTSIDEQGIPHGLKPSPSHINVPAPYGLAKPVSHNMMSPVHQGVSHPNTAFSPFPGNVNHALSATRASSFAAALRKLAKQAVDPIAEKELSPISPASSPASSQHSNQSRHHSSMPIYMNSHNPNPPGHGSPTPMVNVSQGKALDLGRYVSSSRNGGIIEPVSMKVESSKMISSSNNDKRNEMMSVKHVPPPTMPHNIRQENNSSRGFQPYRNSDERHPTPPHMYNASPPPSTMSGYSYHHPSLVQSSRMQPQSYRLDDPVYMERYGLLRPSTMPYPPPNTNIMSHSRAPHYPSNQYPPELISQRSASNNSSYNSSRYNTEEENAKESNLIRQREMEMYRERERYIEREEAESREREAEYFRKERNRMRQSPVPLPHSTSRLESEEKGHMGSIIHGTPREYTRSLSPVPSSSAPLNLATNIPHMETPLSVKEEYISRQPRQNNNSLVNGQLHPRNSNQHTGLAYYRKEQEMSSSHRMPYQMNVSRENESKPHHAETPESKLTIFPRPKGSSNYYVERENKNGATFETRTLSMASVINSQINGIFAREKFPSNNSFDYLNSFVAKSEHSPDNQNKMESDSKTASPPQENFSVNSKEFENEKTSIKESLKNESPSNKLPGFVLNVPPALFRGDVNDFSENYKLRDLSASGMLLNSSEIPPFHDSADERPRLVSVLDAREQRLRKLRMTREVADSDESEIESDEEDEERLKVLLSIKKGPPPKMDSNPKKLKFLSKLDLTIPSKIQAIELHKCIKRHQALREKSMSPVDMEPIKEPEIEYDVEHLNELAKRLCFEEEFQEKSDFLRSLQLSFIPLDQREDKERLDKIVLQDKLRRNGLLKSNSEGSMEVQSSILGKRDYSVLNNVKSEIIKKPNLNQEKNINDSGLDRMFSDKKFFPASESSQIAVPLPKKISSFLKPPMKTVNLPVPPLIPTNQIPAFAETTQDKGAVIAPKDPRVRQINKDFVEEFHKSVLQTTQMQLEKKNSSSGLIEHAFYKSPESESVEKTDWYYDRPPFQWPGIEAIMESYECHISEQTSEKKFLIESCQKLNVVNQESNIEIECLQKRTEELMQEKMYLDSEKRELQKQIESLKLFIDHFR
ncbi:uncharacterized protein [Parasteatoda tepidariorum]|uniref:uncharacterized protein isoform X2 n=1 Tax=Parasteatoda tepidariorum TaxID=114398 RepID=UPI00077FDB12|nr:uncharacterized protein LOC107442879 isoform X2 [Parasteatoda tepidariorum]